MKTTDRIATQGDWALASDGLQWMLMRRQQVLPGPGPIGSPSRSSARQGDILARCMREKGVGAATARFLLAGLPSSFDEWKALQHRRLNADDAARPPRQTVEGGAS